MDLAWQVQEAVNWLLKIFVQTWPKYEEKPPWSNLKPIQ
jgi:hypothetical protein